MSDPEPSSSDSIHRGYDLETGLLARVRQWTDVFGWIRLGRVLRVAASPPLLMLTAIAMALEWLGHQWLVGSSPSGLVDSQLAFLPEFARHALLVAADGLTTTTPTTVLWHSALGGIVPSVVAKIWSVLIWTPVVLVLVRQGALLTAGRPMAGMIVCLKESLGRTVAAWIAAWIPLICALVLASPLLLTAAVSGWFADSQPARDIWAAVSIVIAIPAALLAFGSILAVPMAWSAIANESAPDPLDSLSRGYEYLFRRPLSCVLYAAIVTVPILVVAGLASGLSSVAVALVANAMSITGVGGEDSESLVDSAMSIGLLLPSVLTLTLAWSLIGGIYLLLRRDANGQEVEDLWQPPADAPAPLPKLKTS